MDFREFLIKKYGDIEIFTLDEIDEAYVEFNSNKLDTSFNYPNGFQIRFMENKFMNRGGAILVHHPDDINHEKIKTKNKA